MKAVISGMCRTGRLALRAAIGATDPQSDDSRASNRSEVVHLSELKDCAAAWPTWLISTVSKAVGGKLLPTAIGPSGSKVNSSVHSYLIPARAGSEKAAEDVDFYDAANAPGRFLGILMSGMHYPGGQFDVLAGRLGR